MRNTIAKRIRKGLKPGQTRQDYQKLKETYKGLPIPLKTKIAKAQNKAKALASVSRCASTTAAVPV